jgi:hypothetical protein
MIRGEYILAIGIIADMITTIVGVSKGLGEANIFGYETVLIMNFIILFFMMVLVSKPVTKYGNIVFYCLGGFRICVATYNLILIIKYGGI